MSSWRQLLRDSVQRRKLSASNPISNAIRKFASNTAMPPAPSAFRAKSTVASTAIQPNSANHNRCEISQNGPKTMAQK
jgi:hypothetical protein